MKKGITMGIVAISLIMSIAFSGIVVASDLFVGRDLQIEGVGMVDFDLEVQTEKNYEGLKLEDWVFSPRTWDTGASYINYTSEFELGIYNRSCVNASADMIYTQAIKAVGSKQRFTSQNYVLGAASGFKYSGNVDQAVTVYTDNTLSESALSGAINGRMTIFQKVVDPETKVVIMRDVSAFVGTYKYNHNTYVESMTYPAGESDYLGCP